MKWLSNILKYCQTNKGARLGSVLAEHFHDGLNWKMIRGWKAMLRFFVFSCGSNTAIQTLWYVVGYVNLATTVIEYWGKGESDTYWPGGKNVVQSPIQSRVVLNKSVSFPFVFYFIVAIFSSSLLAAIVNCLKSICKMLSNSTILYFERKRKLVYYS